EQHLGEVALLETELFEERELPRVQIEQAGDPLVIAGVLEQKREARVLQHGGVDRRGDEVGEALRDRPRRRVPLAPSAEQLGDDAAGGLIEEKLPALVEDDELQDLARIATDR